MGFFDYTFSQYHPLFYITVWFLVPFHIPYMNLESLYERFIVALFSTIVYSFLVSLYRAIALKTIYGYFYLYPESFKIMTYLRKKNKAYFSEISNVTKIPIDTVKFYISGLERYDVIRKEGKMVEMI